MSSKLKIDALGERGLERVLITGANGFIGRALCAHLGAQGVVVTAVTRDITTLPGAARVQAVGDFTEVRDWAALIADNDAVVHLAALTHGGTRRASSARFRAINVDVSVRVAEAALACGIQRFVYLSSIKVNGESSSRDKGGIHAYTGSDLPMPADDYGRSKLAAEQALRALWPFAASALTILRPPLVYGPGQKGNLVRLMGLVARGVPLPCGAIDNRRSLIYVENLVEAVVCALGVAVPGVRCYTVADVDVSTPQLVRALARGLGVQARLIGLPMYCLRRLTRWPLLGSSVRSLTDSLVVDASAIRAELGWRPAIGFDAAIAHTCAAWREAQA